MRVIFATEEILSKTKRSVLQESLMKEQSWYRASLENGIKSFVCHKYSSDYNVNFLFDESLQWLARSAWSVTSERIFQMGKRRSWTPNPCTLRLSTLSRRVSVYAQSFLSRVSVYAQTFLNKVHPIIRLGSKWNVSIVVERLWQGASQVDTKFAEVSEDGGLREDHGISFRLDYPRGLDSPTCTIDLADSKGFKIAIQQQPQNIWNSLVEFWLA